jgi:S-adenosylmethionine-diacylglycerol 3-amino-3-carboxypropyl transferase
MTDIPDTGAQLGAAVHQNSATSTTGLLERLFSSLFHGLVYPQIWEDPVVDMAALALTADDDLVCIASGGCNMMSYLTARPRSIVAVDLSPAHVALGRLKLAAAQHLPDHAAFYDFFGHADRAQNVARYDALLAPKLDAETRAYWQARNPRGRRVQMFARGFYRHGVLGRFLGTVHLMARLARVDFRPLLDCGTLDEQRRFYQDKVSPLFDNRLIRALSRRRASLFGLGIPPAQYDKLAADGGGDVLPVLRERVRRLICDFPIAENYFAHQAFTRAYAPKSPRALPPYLQAEAFHVLQAQAGTARIVNRALTDLLAEEPAGSKSAYVFLDAQDWMTDAQLNALWREVGRTARPGARVIFRTGGTADILPGRLAPELLQGWIYDAVQSAAGHAADRSAIYGGFHLYRRVD